MKFTKTTFSECVYSDAICIPLCRRYQFAMKSVTCVAQQAKNVQAIAPVILREEYFGWLPGRGDPTGSYSLEQQAVRSLGLGKDLY
jgi:hypothetical protein